MNDNIMIMSLPGLIRSYNLAASMAEGSILTFLRPECEVNVGWLQPIVARLSEFPVAVVASVLDKLDVEGGFAASDSSGRGGKLFAKRHS